MNFRNELTEQQRFDVLPTLSNGVIFNPKKILDGKMLAQLNQRVTLPHINNSEKLGEILDRAIKQALPDCQDGYGERNDTCIRLTISNFTIVYNKKANMIRSVRKDDKVECKKTLRIHEKSEIGEWFKMLDEVCLTDGEIYDGYRIVPDDSYDLVVENVCKCVEVEV